MRRGLAPPESGGAVPSLSYREHNTIPLIIVIGGVQHYSLDSLTEIENRNFITRMFESNLQVLELLASSSIEGLSKLVVTKTKTKLPET